MGVGDSDDRLREVQRRLPEDFDGVHVMSTLGIDPPGGCHYPANPRVPRGAWPSEP
jgi:hypothetical protein